MDKKTIGLSALIAIIGIIIIVFSTMIVIVEAGHVGVYDMLGNVSDDELQPGFHFKNPVATVYQMSTRTQEYTMSYMQGEGAKYSADVISALTKEGLTVDLDMTVLYRLESPKASDVYKTVGLNYVDVIVRPQIRTAIRDVVALYDAKQIYSEERQTIGLEIFDEMEPSLKERGIILEKVLIRHVQIPDELTKAIEQKLTAEQNIAKKAFEVQEAQQEANRKREEAQGIADANTIISNSLTNNYLRWYWIDSLQNQQSIYYVPVGTDGLPIMKIIDE